ncbi:MAG: pyrroline-5-carboxylate reductase [Candidatus Omnitrophica bacterium]|nr:pyrroline-5-carboxylate reductase [Candidatus Omnitrophota bacterium]
MKRIGIIGCGNMGEALIRGILSRGLVNKRDIFVHDLRKSRVSLMKRCYGVKTKPSSNDLIKSCQTIIVAVKPQNIGLLLTHARAVLNKTKLLISIAAGVDINSLFHLSGGHTQITRVMPNMPALVGSGVSALAFSRGVKPGKKKLARSIFGSVGEVIEVKEDLLDAVTAISGSGPAYFFYLVEVLLKYGLDAGIKRADAQKLAVYTALGSGEALAKTGISAEKLRSMVTSKRGTTEAAFKVFKRYGLGKTLKQGIRAAERRARQLRGG